MERYLNLKLIVGHMGLGLGLTDDAACETPLDLLDLARHPNVAGKASGAPSYSGVSCYCLNIHDYLHRVFDAFRPDRTFWGTDIPRMPCSWKECIILLTEELPWLAGNVLDMVMGRALCRWTGWELRGVQ